jgi:hydrogenase maturation protease
VNKEILVLGIGNILLRDEGVGIHVIEYLQKQAIPQNVDVLDGGTAGFDLLDIISDRRVIILIDAIDAGHPPATVVRFTPEDLQVSSDPQLSVHNIDFAQALKMAAMMGCAPHKVIIFGVQPQTVEPGLALTEPIARLVPHIAALVLDELKTLSSTAPDPSAPYYGWQK